MAGPMLDSCDWCVVKLVVALILSHHHGTRWGRDSMEAVSRAVAEFRSNACKMADCNS